MNLSPMAVRIRRLYREGKITADYVQNAVVKHLITQEEADIILTENKP